jgi:CRP-like cAMP-binding protein
MPQSISRRGLKNQVLSRLARADFALLRPDLVPVDLSVPTQLETANRRIDAVYFMESGFASVVADGPGKRSIEVGIIGREGMTGLSIVLGHDRAPHETYIQLAGTGHRLRAAKLRDAIHRSAGLHRSLLRCVHAFLLQTTHTAIANGRSKNEERLARWLLMAADRIDGNELPLAHKFLGLMLGVQRPAVTVAVQALVRKGLISARRQVITITNRKGLVSLSNGTYLPPS